MDDFLSLAAARRSIRQFSPAPVPFDDVVEALKAATHAPSPGDIQPWRFIVITERWLVQAVAEHCPQQVWVANAPTLVVVVGQTGRASDFYGAHGSEWTKQSCAAATQNLLLAAQERGLGACWVGSFEPDAIRDLLKIPDGYVPEAIVALGLPAETPAPKTVQPLDHVVFFNWFGTTMVDDSTMAVDVRKELLRRKEEFAGALRGPKERLSRRAGEAKESAVGSLKRKVRGAFGKKD